MNLEELKIKLKENNIQDSWYALDDGLKPDACILYKNYSKWEYFYLDEKGGRNDFRCFYVESEAFDFFWSKMEYRLNFVKKFM